MSTDDEQSQFARGKMEEYANSVLRFANENRGILSLEQLGLLAEVDALLSALADRTVTASQPRISSNIVRVFSLWDKNPPELPPEQFTKKVDYLLGLIGVFACQGLSAENHAVGSYRPADSSVRPRGSQSQ